MNLLGRRAFLTGGLGLAVAAQSHRTRQTSRHPNVVFFMTDDHGAWATSVYGCAEMHTPNLDRLARGGMRFDNAFAATPVCSPSRVTYFTGKLPYAHGVQEWILPRESFGPNSIQVLKGHETFTEVLARHGYHIGLSGKWHMGGDEQAQEGFTDWYTVPGGGGPYKDVEFVKNGKKILEKGFKTDHVGDGAVDFLNRHQAERPQDPFFLYTAFYAPHTPYNYQPEVYREPYANAKFDCFPRLPQNPRQNVGLVKDYLNEESMRAYSALITGLDANIGKVLAKLEEMGVLEDTLIIFTADQGWNAGQHGVWGKGNGTIPRNMYEESIRVPMVWQHPGNIAPGSHSEAMISSYDFFPTILDYLGFETKPDKDRVGKSYSPILRGAPPSWRDRLYFEYADVRAIRTKTLKLLRRAKPWPDEMYDLEADPDEAKNVIDDPRYQATRARLTKELDDYFRDHGAPTIDNWRRSTRVTVTGEKSIAGDLQATATPWNGEP
ncbi:MAG: sulfatase-like hydrolase/transferase [Bryobacterales bacterium]|nr:sulfatase-like hydrolase/transferase [Bryobacterales bacterium]